MKLFRKTRQKLLSEKKVSNYLVYALGEIVLVVIGILIAIQINDWNRDRELDQEELKSYKLIIADLKKDSTLFKAYQGHYTKYMDTYFLMNHLRKSQGSFKNTLPDFLVSVVEFNPVTQKNHQIYIEKYRNAQIRDLINTYFRRLNQANQATEEFNRLITEESRPFLLQENDTFNNKVVFDDTDRTFPPLRGISALDTTKLKGVFSHQDFLPILSSLRMSLGFYLTSLEFAMVENHKLIKSLESSLE
ncbi:MAG: DUF6090 family protein [Bacteroidota bacterium]